MSPQLVASCSWCEGVYVLVDAGLLALVAADLAAEAAVGARQLAEVVGGDDGSVAGRHPHTLTITVDITVDITVYITLDITLDLATGLCMRWEFIPIVLSADLECWE